MVARGIKGTNREWPTYADSTGFRFSETRITRLKSAESKPILSISISLQPMEREFLLLRLTDRKITAAIMQRKRTLTGLTTSNKNWALAARLIALDSGN